MMTPGTYVKRGALVTAEPFDPSRPDQGVAVWEDADGVVQAATMESRGRVVNVRPGDILVTDRHGTYPCPADRFAHMYEALDLTVTIGAELGPDMGAHSDHHG